MKKDFTDKEIIKIIRHKANSCIADAEKLEKEASELREKAKTFENTIVHLGGHSSFVRTKFNRQNKTFIQSIIEIFKDERPRTSRQVYNDYCELNPNNNIKDFYGFSGRFSNIMKSAGIGKHEIPENPLPIRFVYGFKNWFDGEKLKNEYFENIDFDK